MPNKLTQPKADRYIQRLCRNDHFGIGICVENLKEELYGAFADAPNRTEWTMSSVTKRMNKVTIRTKTKKNEVNENEPERSVPLPE